MERNLPCIAILHIDTNLINARQKLPAVNQLEKWFDEGIILINMSATAHREAKADYNEIRTRKANQQIYTATLPVSPLDPFYAKVEAALFPEGARNDNQQNDVRIVCEAAKYGAILVTADGGSKTQPGGILGNRHKLVDVLQIFSPNEAVDFIHLAIGERNKY